MSKIVMTDTIPDFLWGRLNDLDISDFLGFLETNDLLRREFEKELACEALFFGMSWNIQTAPGLEKEHSLDQNTAFEWNNVIKGAFDKVFPLPTPKSKSHRTIPFPKAFRYLAAACIVGAIAAVAFLLQTRQNAEKPIAAIVVASDTTREKKSINNDTAIKTASVTSFAFDSIIIYSPRSFAGKPIFTETHDGIVRIGDKTAILLDKNTFVAVTSLSDSAVAIDLNSGNALFTVEKHRFNQFSITTPACDIAVTGTIFRLAIENDMTIVSVLEGSVKANKRHDTTTVSINAGMSARIKLDTIMIEYGDSAATLLYRSNILSDFLHENGVFENGMFVRSGIAKKKETPGQDHGVERTILDKNN